ncbi:response regulator transcription factor [Streptomyces sp. NPDC056411]|uniref:response regulator transcription factor n=1 Tax=Streptomyces sp. NPDC056411 TaxID=3345813 RepID=UPI0035DE2CB0
MRGQGQRILVASGDPTLVDLLATTLELAGYQVATAGTGREVNEVLARLSADRLPHLIVVDAALSDVHGLGAALRRLPTAPPRVLVLADSETLALLVSRLNPGVSDYVTKPFRVVEFLARTQTLLQGGGPAQRKAAPRYGDLVLDADKCLAWRGRRRLDLTPAEYRLLHHFLVNAEQVLSKAQIWRHVWGEARADSAIEKLVSRLRQKVDQEQPRLIHTHRGFGYWLGNRPGA